MAASDSWESPTASVCVAPAAHSVFTPGGGVRPQGTGWGTVSECGPLRRQLVLPGWSPLWGAGSGRERRAEDLPEATLPGLEGVWGGRKGLSVLATHPSLDSWCLRSACPARRPHPHPRGNSPLPARIRQSERISRYTERKSPWGASCRFAFRFSGRFLNENRPQAHLYPRLWPAALGSPTQGDCLPPAPPVALLLDQVSPSFSQA